MSLNTVNDIPKIVERLRSVCSRKGLPLVDITRKHIKTEKWCDVVEKLMETTPIVVRWGEGYATNRFLEHDIKPNGVKTLVKISYKDKAQLINEMSLLPESNLHIFLDFLFRDKEESMCVACMNYVKGVIPCITCGNDTYCDECMINAVDRYRDQIKCPLCRSPKFFEDSFMSMIAGHPTLYKKYRDRHLDMKDPFANVLMQVNNPLYETWTRSN